MRTLLINRISRPKQFLISALTITCVSAICFMLSDYIDYRMVALVLLLAVSLVAVTLDILPVLLAAALSALIWDMFFIPPRFNFLVSNTDDGILLATYFIISMVNAVLTYKIREIDKVARQKEEKANAIKLYNTLLNSLSHELRTPIATIIGATDNLQDNNTNLTAEHKSQLVEEISKASLRLNQQVENLLNMSRLETGILKPRKDWCDISELVYDTVERMDDRKNRQRIHINIDPAIPLFRTDKMMIEQILQNLLNNAVIHTRAGTRIDISARNHGNLLEMVVEDQGSGIPESEVGHAFEKFYRLERTKAPGTGLGLSIVKGFTEALSGSVILTNVAPSGAQFRVQIPAETSRIKAYS
jgi:two-component system sensor histidine kinase KdpD